MITSWFAGVQLSVATMSATTDGTAAWHCAPAGSVAIAGPLTMTGAVESTTFKTTEQPALLPDGSVTVTTIECCPRPTSVPAAGAWLTTNEFCDAQLSVAWIWDVTFGTVAWQFRSTFSVIGAGQLTTGAVVSTTVT